MGKKISIIIPCYNVENYLDRCFQSLRKQTLGFEQMELIFVNDASTDGTIDKLTALEEQYPDNIILINLPENRGLSAVRNIGLEYASAPYIGYVDSDDWVDITMFEKMVSAIEKHDCDFVECRFDRRFDDNHKVPVETKGKPGYWNLSDPLVQSEFIDISLEMTPQWNKVFRKSFLVDNDIFDPEKLYYEDIFFCGLAFLYAQSCYRIDEELYHYFINPNGIVASKDCEYPFDHMKVALFFLQICRERGLAEQYKYDVEWIFLRYYYIITICEVIVEFPERSYSYFLQLRDTVRELVPDYSSNPYRTLENHVSDNLVLKLLDYNLDENSFIKLSNQIKKIIKP